MPIAARNSTNASDDRVLIIKPLDNGKNALSSKGLIDNRLFTGENYLHAKLNYETRLWSCKYEKGALPPALREQTFTSFPKLLKHYEEYFSKRNIAISEVIHA